MISLNLIIQSDQHIDTFLIVFQSCLKLINNKMSKSPQNRHDENMERISKPKRREEKSLPLIQNKKVPLHQIQSNKMHVDKIGKQSQPAFWAYVPFKSRSIQRREKSNSSIGFNQSVLSMSRSNFSVDPSVTLLDKYFQRKHQTRLKDVVRFIEDVSDYTAETIGYDQIQIFQSIIRKRQKQIAFLNSTKRNRFDKIKPVFDPTLKNKRSHRERLPKTRFQSFIEEHNNSQIDNYFVEERQQ